ncbi:MAG: T9SS type A sorting domain-containing protein [Bacteroidetes bacterium]|nr:T9SS type A sorting domain-containing protein [Bacteroidota bacterium]
MTGRFKLLLGFITLGSTLTAQEFVPSAPVNVAPGYGNYHPQIEVLGDGELGVVWTSSATNDLFFARRNGIDQFDVPVKLNPDSLDVQDYNWSGADLAVWGNNVYVIFRSLGYEDGHVYLVKSTDNGLTFGDTVRVDNLASGFAQFPDVAVYNDTVFATYMKYDDMSMNPRYILTRSVDGGNTFETEVEAGSIIGDEACDCCQPEIVVNADKVLLFFRNNASNIRDIKAVVSYDRGQTFSDWISVDDHNWLITSCPSTGPDARFVGNDVVVGAYRTMVSGQPKIFLNEYNLATDASLNLVDVYMDGASGSGINYPQIYYAGNLLGIVWEGLGESTDVFFNASNTGAAGIIPANAINVTDAVGSQSKPDMAILNGSFHIVYAELSGAEVKYCRVSSVNGTAEMADNAVSVYPNPVNGNQVTVELKNSKSAGIQVQLFDLSGRLVFSTTAQPVAGKIYLNLDAVSDGSYLLRINDGVFSYDLKLIK